RTGGAGSTTVGDDACGNASASAPASWYSNGKTDVNVLDKRISFICTQVHPSLLFELPRNAYHLSMSTQRIFTPDWPQRVHLFFQHLHCPRRQRLVEPFAQFRTRPLQCHSQQAALHCIRQFAQLSVI